MCREEQGGAVRAGCGLTPSHSTISGNGTSGGISTSGYGGGVSGARVTITNSTICGNPQNTAREAAPTHLRR